VPRLRRDTTGPGPGARAAGAIRGAGTLRRAREERSRTPEPERRTASPGRTAVTVRPATTPPPTQSEKTAATLHFPPPWSPSCDASMVLRQVALKFCLHAGLRAAGLPLHDGVKLLGVPYPCSSPSSGDETSICVCMRTMCGSRTGGWSLPCVMSD
jgi:hypothetical protein